MEHLTCISRHVSNTLPCMLCLQIVDAGPSHVLTKKVDCCSVVPIALLLLVKVLRSQVGRL